MQRCLPQEMSINSSRIMQYFWPAISAQRSSYKAGAITSLISRLHFVWCNFIFSSMLHHDFTQMDNCVEWAVACYSNSNLKFHLIDMLMFIKTWYFLFQDTRLVCLLCFVDCLCWLHTSCFCCFSSVKYVLYSWNILF